MLPQETLELLLNRLPIWRRLKEMPDRLDRLERRLRSIEDQLPKASERCPYCQQPTLELVDVRPDEAFAELGDEKHRYECSTCGKVLERHITRY